MSSSRASSTTTSVVVTRTSTRPSCGASSRPRSVRTSGGGLLTGIVSAITQNREKIVRLIIIVVAVVVFSQHKSKELGITVDDAAILGYTTSLASNPPELQAQISALVKDFDESTRAITNGDVSCPMANPFRLICFRSIPMS